MNDEQRMAMVERMLEEWEYFGCKGADLMEQYPHLRELPAQRRKKKFMKIALDRWKMAMTLRSLGESPTDWGLEGYGAG